MASLEDGAKAVLIPKEDARERDASVNGDGTKLTDASARAGGFENAQDEAAFEKPAYKSAILVTMGIFMGYAALNALQRKVKLRIGISDDDKSASVLFSFAVSWLYMGNLVFRAMHNVVFAAFVPRQRVYISLIAMTCSMLVISLLIFWAHIQHIALVFVAYGLGGVAVGSFEANLLSCISPLGHNTKSWAVLGIPIGYVGGTALHLCHICSSSHSLPRFSPFSRSTECHQHWLVRGSRCCRL